MKDDKEIVSKYKAILKNMDYGTNIEKTHGLTDFLNEYSKSKYVIQSIIEKPDFVEVKNIISDEILTKSSIPSSGDVNKESNTINDKLDWLQNNHILQKLSKEILANSDLLSEIEMITRGILIKDTKEKCIPYIISQLKFPCPTKFSFPGYNIHNNFFLGHMITIIKENLMHDHSIILYTEPQMLLTASLLIKLCLKAGVPQNKYVVAPVLNCHSIETFVNAVGFSKTPMIILNNADIDSACAVAVDGIWGYQGNLPWSIGTILVQEDVVEVFLKKFETVMKKLKYEIQNDKFSDISLPQSKEALNKLNNMVKEAALMGIKIIQPKNNFNKFQPTVFVGEFVYNDLSANDCSDIPYATILSFRNASEAISLANNCKQTLATSIWTENIAHANQLAKNLNVCHIWINSYGLFAGNENVRHFNKIDERLDIPNWSDILKNQSVWKKYACDERIAKMLKLAEIVQKNLQNYNGPEKKQMEILLKVIQEAIEEFNLMKIPIPNNANYIISTIITPLNVVYVPMVIDSSFTDKKIFQFICYALLHGNAVVVDTDLKCCGLLSDVLLGQCNMSHLLKMFRHNCHVLRSAPNTKCVTTFCNVKYIWQSG